MADRKVLVAGASGLVGLAAVEHFAAAAEWSTVGISRRVPTAVEGATLLPADLLCPSSLAAVLEAHPDVTHLVYAAVVEREGLSAGWFDEETIRANVRMLENLLDVVERSAPRVRHISLLQGTKAYGVHVPGRQITADMLPLRESSPRVSHRSFYFDQEALVRDRQRRTGWGLTILRPTVVYGSAWGSNMNALLPVLVLAALLKEAGEPLYRPWEADRPLKYAEAVDASLIASALEWTAATPGSWDQTFNLTNGDLFLWADVWTVIARAMGMEVGEHRRISFVGDVAPRTRDWARVVDRHGLQAPRGLGDFVGHNSFVYADRVLETAAPRPGPPLLNSTIAIRRAGFTGCLDTREMFAGRIASLQRARLLPASALDTPKTSLP
jgi:nucleoside-diphosphate-sugar epimerase